MINKSNEFTGISSLPTAGIDEPMRRDDLGALKLRGFIRIEVTTSLPIGSLSIGAVVLCRRVVSIVALDFIGANRPLLTL